MKNRNRVGLTLPLGVALACASLSALAPASLVAQPSATRPAAPARAVPRLATSSVPVASGSSAMYDTFHVLGASSGGVLVDEYRYLGNGSQVGGRFAVLRTGHSTLTDLSIPLASNRFVEEVAINGSTIAAAIVDGGFHLQAVWHDDLTTGATGTTPILAGEQFIAATPNGWVTEIHGDSNTTTTFLITPLSGKAVILATFGVPLVTAIAGPNGMVFAYTGAAHSGVVDYVGYSTPGEVSQLLNVVLPTQDDLSCRSVTTNAVGCLLSTSSFTSATVYRLPIPAAKAVTHVVTFPSDDFPAVWVTPTATAWAPFASGTVTLSRIPAAGGSTVSMQLPTAGPEAANGIVATRDAFYFGQAVNTSVADGLFDVPDTLVATTKPMHLASPPLSPRAAATCAVGGGTVTWVDNAHAGLGIWSRPYTETATSVSLGRTSLLATDGFAGSDPEMLLPILADAGSTMAYFAYNKQPTTYPASVWLHSGGKNSLVSPVGAPIGSLPYPPMAFSGSWLLYPTEKSSGTGWFGEELLNTATGWRTALNMTGVEEYALGSGRLVWVDDNGSVWQEPVGKTIASQLVSPLGAGDTVAGVEGLASAGDYVAWDYYWASKTKSGYAGAYMNVTTKTTRTIPNAKSVYAISLSSQYLGVESQSNLYTIELSSPTATEHLLASNSTGLSISGDVGCWIGDSSDLPFAGKI
jgi:hypothetical protein